MSILSKRAKNQETQPSVSQRSTVIKPRGRQSPRDYIPSELTAAQLIEQYRRRKLYHNRLNAAQKVMLYEEANFITAKMRVLQQSKVIDDATREAISRRVRRLLHTRSILRVRSKLTYIYSSPIILSVAFVLGLPLTFWCQHKFFGEPFLTTFNRPSAILVATLTSLLAIFSVVVPIGVAFWRQKASEVFVSGCIWPFTSLILDCYIQKKLYLLFMGKPSVAFMAASAGAFWGYFFSSSMGLSLCVAFGLAYNVKRVVATRFPDAQVINHVLFILSWLEQKPRSWFDIGTKRAIIERIDMIASTFDRDFPRSLRSGYLPTNIWLQSSCSEMAAPIRVLATWVLRPMPDTREQFTKRIASILVNVATGNWDNLERFQPEKITKKRYIYTATATILRVTLIAFIPAAALHVFHLLRPKFVMPDALIGLVIAWATMTLLANLDPNLSSKISVFKEAVQSVSFPGKTGKD